LGALLFHRAHLHSALDLPGLEIEQLSRYITSSRHKCDLRWIDQTSET
jgi:hypothetical protein